MGAAPGAFSIISNTCDNAMLFPGQQCTVSLRAQPTALGAQTASLVVPDNSSSGLAVPLIVTGASGAAGTYYPLRPARVLDTRTGNGAPKAALGSGGVLHLQVAGRGGVAPSGVSAVVLNVTVTSPTAASYLAVYPSGAQRPSVSNLNFTAGWTGANNVTVPVGSDGKVDIYNLAGATHVIVDVLGFYAGDNTVVGSYGVGGQYQPVLPERLADTRTPAFGGPLPSHYYLVVPVDYGATINAHVRALAVNVTAVNPTGSGFLTTWNGDPNALPTASTVNFTPHAVVPNLAIVPAAPCAIDPSCQDLPSIGIYNGSNGDVHVVVDIVGFFDDSALGDGLLFHPIAPTRITDTRRGLGAPGPIGYKATATVTPPSTVADANTVALAANVTAVSPTAPTYLTLWPADAGLSRPWVSTVNAAAGQIVPNAALVSLGPTHGFNIYNNNGVTDVLVDVAGAFEFSGALSVARTSVATRADAVAGLFSHLVITRPAPLPPPSQSPH
jgi:hypothetical protein